MHFRLCLVVAYAFFSSVLEVIATTSQGARLNVSTFVYPTGDDNLTFALTVVNGGGDVYMHLSAPATYQWVGIGTGSKMAGSVMFIVYENADKLSTTLSPRLSDGHSEPTYSSSVDCDLLNQTSDHGGIIQTGSSRYYSVNIHCKNITAHGEGNGKLDFSNTKQPFIYAWGPTDGAVSSASKSASIKRHDSYGTLWMDLTKAKSSNSDINTTFPEAALLTTQNAGADGQAQSDGDKVGPAHAVIMLVAFVIIFPLGTLLLRFLESVKAHYIIQTIGLLAAVVGIAVGLYLGTMYNHSKDVSSGHQVFGLILLVLLLAQWAIGLYHHLRFRRYKRPTIYGRVHLFAGPAIVLGGIINGFTGFNFSGDSHNNVYYGAVVAVAIVVVLALLGWKRWSKNKQAKHSRMLDDDELHGGSYQMHASHGASH